MRIVLSTLAATLIAALVYSCATTPETNRQQLSLVPESQVNALGEEAYRDLLSKSKLSQNKALNEEVIKVGQRIAQASGADFAWEFNVLAEDKTVNAFCLPGGKVGVYTGIIPIAENTAGLAAVLGHEVAHAVLRHSSERMSQQLVMQLGLALATVSFQNSKYKDLIAGALGVGTVYGITLPFSRYHESEADRVGLEYMAKAGYDPSEAVQLWYRMAEEGGGQRPPEILSTHPDPAQRAKHLQSQLPEVIAIYEGSAKSQTRKL